MTRDARGRRAGDLADDCPGGPVGGGLAGGQPLASLRPPPSRPPRALLPPGSERGTVTAELALALPAVVGLLLVVVLLASAAAAQLRCADAARAGARAAALGEETAVVAAIADRLGGDGASVGVRREGAWVTVTVRRPLAAGPLAVGLTAAGSATARVEP